MRDAIGGAWLMGIVLVFVVLFSSFLAFAVNYSKAFKVKNEIINLIEKNEGWSTMNYHLEDANKITPDNVRSVEGQVYLYLKSIGYNVDPAIQKSLVCPTNLYGANHKAKIGNYCIRELKNTKPQDTRYYRVTSFVMIEFPILSQSFNVPVSGETKRIYYEFNSVD